MCSLGICDARASAIYCRMPVGGPQGGPLQVTLDQSMFDQLSTELFQKARLPLDQACWTAGEWVRSSGQCLCSKTVSPYVRTCIMMT